MPDSDLLPPEIWLEVFRWATTPDNGSCDHSVSAYIPFQPPIHSNISDPIITIRSALPLVCRQWKHLSDEFLYQDLKLVPQGTHALKDAFSQGKYQGRWVRRVVLPYPSTVTRSYNAAQPSIEILRRCPNLETLVRPPLSVYEDLYFHFNHDDAEHLPLLSLRRLDWWLLNEAERSGGINSLGSVLRSAPNIQYLSIGGVVPYSRIRMDPVTEPLCLSVLQTLRLHTGHGLFLRQIQSWGLPALSRIILDSPMIGGSLEGIWQAFGSQLRVIEFGRHVRFLLADVLSACLLACPNLTEINYYLFFTAPPEIRHPHESINTVGLHAAANMLFQDDGEVCSHLEQHLEILKNSLPILRRVVLYGEWEGISSHPRFDHTVQSLRDRGTAVEFPSLPH